MALYLQNISKYWLFQFLGWMMFAGINIFFAFTYKLFDAQFIGRLGVYVAIGLLMSHFMRMTIKWLKLLQRNINYQLIGFILISIVFATAVGIGETYLSMLARLEYKEEAKWAISQKISSNVFSSFIYLFIWNCIYFIYHYVAESRKNQLDNLKLEALVKSLELKTIKSHINPHFIFNAMNSIRALIDENPNRAREAVTALSNILRSSMSSDQHETITLEQELNIVKDYLALELIRFEDRLHVHYGIEEDTLDHQVPPMMLQTLVENAIKHGIGKTVHKGEISILANEAHGQLVLSVINSGLLEIKQDHEGFGLQSTSNRLQLIFGESASFSIKQLNQDMVEAKVNIPLS
jgi:two-component system LytT family sensor kinase